MRAVIQRVSRAQVTVDQQIIGQIANGLLVLLGVEQGDTTEDVAWLAAKIPGLRIFEDDAGKMNLAVTEVGGAILAVSQFTLLGDCRKGRRPSFANAADPATARQLYELFVQQLRDQRLLVETGQFQAQMEVLLVNDGPVTLLLDTRLTP